MSTNRIALLPTPRRREASSRVRVMSYDYTDIGHAIAYCEMMLSLRDDPGEQSDLEMIRAYKDVLPISALVSIIKESVARKCDPIQAQTVIQEMESREFRRYVSRIIRP